MYDIETYKEELPEIFGVSRSEIDPKSARILYPKNKKQRRRSPITDKLNKIFGKFILVVITVSPLVVLPGHLDACEIPKTLFLHLGILILLALFLIRLYLARILLIPKNPIFIFMVFFIAVGWLSLSWAMNPWEGLCSATNWTFAFLLFLMVQTYVPTSPAYARHFSQAFLLGGFLVSLMGLSQYYFDWQYPLFSTKLGSTFINKNLAVHYLMLVLPLFPYLWWEDRNKKTFYINILFFITILIYLVFTRTRSGWLAVLACAFTGVVIFYLADPLKSISFTRLRRHWLIPGVMLVFLIIVLGLNFYIPGKRKEGLKMGERFSSIVNYSEGSGRLRLSWWGNSLEMFQDHPFGVGMGNFKIYYPLYHKTQMGLEDFGVEERLIRAHNDFLQILLETGIIGFFFYIGVLTCYFVYVLRLIFKNKARSNTYRLISWGLAAQALLIVSFFSFPLQLMLPLALLFFNFGLQTRLDLNPSQDFFVLRGPLSLWCSLGIGMTVLVSGLIYFIYFDIPRFTADAHFHRGINAYQGRNYKKSLQELKKVQEIKHHNSVYYFILGKVLIKNRDYDSALKIIQKGLRLDPFNPFGHDNQGLAYYYKEKYQEAISSYSRALMIRPDWVSSYVNMGNLYARQNRFSKAKSLYKKAIKYNKNVPNAYHNLGNLYLVEGKYKRALKYYRKFARLSKSLERYNAYIDIGKIYKYYLNDYNKSVIFFRKALKCAPNENSKNYVMKLIKELNPP